MKLYDSHCHLHYSPLYERIDEVIHNARDLKYMLCVSVDIDDYKQINKLIHKGNIGQSIGIHPLNAHKYSVEEIQSYLNKSDALNVVAIGETGLDNFRSPLDTMQITSFQLHMNRARELNIPVIMHTRAAAGDSIVETESMELIRSNSDVRGVAHCFGGSLEFAMFLLQYNWYISFAGNLTYKKSNLVGIAKEIPLDRILIETDSPFLSPEPFRGKENEPANVFYVAQKLAEIKRMSIDDLTEQLHINFQRFLGGD